MVYKSAMYATANEDGMEEIEIERDRDLFELSSRLLRGYTWKSSKTITETWVLEKVKSGNGVISKWVDKWTGVPARGELQVELFGLKSRIQMHGQFIADY